MSPHYDSMLGKLIAHAPTREQAITQLASALDQMVLLGLPTNRRFLAACLRHPVFLAGDALIPFLAEHGDEIRATLHAEEDAVLDTAARAVLLPQGAPAALANPFVRPARIEHRDRQLPLNLRETEGAAPSAANAVRLPDGRRHVQMGAVDLFLRDASFDPPASSAAGGGANELRAPFNGKVIALKAEPGQRVAKGEALVVLESMKLEHALAATRDGTVKALHVSVGQQAATSQVLVTFEPA